MEIKQVEFLFAATPLMRILYGVILLQSTLKIKILIMLMSQLSYVQESCDSYSVTDIYYHFLVLDTVASKIF